MAATALYNREFIRSLNGDVDKEGGRWHQIPHVILQVNMPVPCKSQIILWN
jgi:hypothetical protein